MAMIAKYFKLILAISLCLYILTLFVAWNSQLIISSKYSVNFDAERIKLGVYPITDLQKTDDEFWDNFCPDNPYERWKAILTNVEIANSTTYSATNNMDNSVQRRKIVFYGTKLSFWQNYYGGEIDFFVKNIDNEQQMELLVAYYSVDLVPSNYFYANIDTVKVDSPDFICGTQLSEKDRDIPKGNLTKDQADKILKKWGFKIR